GLSLDYREKYNLDALIWLFANSMSGMILIVGLLFLLYSKSEKSLSITAFILLTILLVLFAVTLIYYAASVIQLPDMWFKDAVLSRPYELISVCIYLSLIIFIYPAAYRAYPNILVDCIFYMSVTQIVVAIYLMLVSNTPYDSAYNIAYFLKVIAYTIPCSCFVINYIFSYSQVLNAQKRLKIKQEELKYIASHDSLTNLYNRREFEELLDKSLSNSARDKHQLALLLIDLDNFKSTNDTFGHVHGDKLLKQFSQRLVLLIRNGDLLSRVGGDEFTLIAPNIQTPAAARHLAERILNELNNPYPINGKLITVTVSIGIAMYPEDGRTTEELLRKADLAMYKSKNCGKNNYQFYTNELSNLQHHESEIEAHLRKALQNDDLELYYQPKYKLNTREIVGAEILLRWTSETLGEMAPDDFIPIAERSGLIVDLGHWVLRKACDQITAWGKQYNNSLSFSINISSMQLVHGQFLNNLEKVLAHFDYPHDKLELEITETLLMNYSDELTQVLIRISKMGLKISLDDFGKEYSSLNRLRALPIDTLKIDKAFLSDIHNSADKVVIVDIIIKLANELGMNIIAEGIETEQQLNYLIARNCQFGQGFLFSKAVPASEFALLAYKNITIVSPSSIDRSSTS
ncbi:MAG: EAL domain-containing protein, partial [Legionella sp.]